MGETTSTKHHACPQTRFRRRGNTRPAWRSGAAENLKNHGQQHRQERERRWRKQEKKHLWQNIQFASLVIFEQFKSNSEPASLPLSHGSARLTKTVQIERRFTWKIYLKHIWRNGWSSNFVPPREIPPREIRSWKITSPRDTNPYFRCEHVSSVANLFFIANMPFCIEETKSVWPWLKQLFRFFW